MRLLQATARWALVSASELTAFSKDRTVSHLSEADGLVSNQTRCLLEDKDGSLWIGSEGGLSGYKEGKFANFTIKHGLGDNSIRALCQDRHGTIRAATLRGLSSVDNERSISNLNFPSCICIPVAKYLDNGAILMTPLGSRPSGSRMPPTGFSYHLLCRWSH